ncbi:MAG: type 4a pilus biogenesis protein PilO [Candidatus Omnitrophica bacterium]|nr:type 4a pilus biogenesis protein PilO [Candidatus Omnitrophota bacterium]
MNIRTPDKKFLVIVISGAVLFALDIFFILRPLINKTMDLRSQIVSVKKNIANLEQQIQVLDATQQRMTALKGQAAECEKKFPKNEEIPSLLENISATAAKSGVDIVAIRPVKKEPQAGKEKANDLFHEIPIEILAKGGYHQLGQFINRLEVSARFMEVKGIDLIRDPAFPRRHNLKLLVSTYILKI